MLNVKDYGTKRGRQGKLNRPMKPRENEAGVSNPVGKDSPAGAVWQKNLLWFKQKNTNLIRVYEFLLTFVTKPKKR